MLLRNSKATLALIPAALTLAIPALFTSPAQANVFHRHPTASGVGAGLVAHHMAKRHGHGFMHRHPVMTGLAAGAVTHHMLKRHHSR